MLKFILLLISFNLFCLHNLNAEELTFEKELKQKIYPTGFKLPKNWKEKAVFKSAKSEGNKFMGSLPRHYDLREKGKLSPIEDQGDCGSCYTFSTTATLQDSLSLRGIQNPDLSEEYLLSCNNQGFGCDGGFFLHDMHVNPGAVLGADFPYKAKVLQCPSNLKHPYKITSWSYIPTSSQDDVPNVDEIKNAIYNYGTVAAGVAVTNDFMAYKNGIFNKCTTTTQPNHAINLVGWDDDGQYWIMRNSWSSRWGENGYMRIKWNCNYIGVSANYIVVNNSPVPPQCSPMPEANLGPDKVIRRGMNIIIGVTAKPGTTYRWESSVKPDPTAKTSQIQIQPWNSRYYTIYATTKCGTAKSTIMVYVRR